MVTARSMTRDLRRTAAFVAALIGPLFGASRALAQPAAAPTPDARVWLALTVIVVLALIGLAALVFINAALGRTKQWSLSNALSEETDLPAKDSQGNTVLYNGAPVLEPVLVASTSRLIALYGLFAILLLYLGCGAFVLYDLGTGQPLPADLDQVEKFLMTGLTLFAPYLVNKFASVFESLAPKNR
jgi:hypothetical protein